VLIAFLCDHLFDPVQTFPDIPESGVKGCHSQTDIIGLTEIWDHFHLFDQRPVDTVTVWMAKADMRTSLACFPGSSQGETEWSKPSVKKIDQVGCELEGFFP
jgi:hypothetical protein